MRVAFISSGDPVMDTFPSGGGIQHQIWGLAKELTNQGHDCHILSRCLGQEYEQAEGVHIHGIKVALSDPIISRLILSKKMRKKVLEIKPDALYLSDIFTSFFLLKMNIPKLYVTHNTFLNWYKKYAIQTNKLNFFLFDFKRKLEDYTMKNVDMVCPTTKSIEKFVRSRGISNTFVIPHAIDTEIYRNDGDSGFIFYAGQFIDRKGVHYLLEAFNSLPPEFDEYFLILRGEGNNKKKLIESASNSRKKDKIKFLPWTTKEELANDYARCTLSVLPTLIESFGISIIEAMASEKPVIASNVVGPNDIITHEEDGLLFEAKNVDELKKCLERVLADVKLRDKIGRKARKTVEENYSFYRVSNMMIEVCEQLKAGQ
jgi:glycosyltransferase involved in cell wall biosynthesis